MKLNMQIEVSRKGFCLEKSISRQIKLVPNGLAQRIQLVLKETKNESRVLFWKAVGLGDASPRVSITVIADDAIIVSRNFSACVEKSTGSVESADEIVKEQIQTVFSDIWKSICAEAICSFKKQKIS